MPSINTHTIPLPNTVTTKTILQSGGLGQRNNEKNGGSLQRRILPSRQDRGVRCAAIPFLVVWMQPINLCRYVPANCASDRFQPALFRYPGKHLLRGAIAVLDKHRRVLRVFAYPFGCQFQAGNKRKPLCRRKLLFQRFRLLFVVHGFLA